MSIGRYAAVTDRTSDQTEAVVIQAVDRAGRILMVLQGARRMSLGEIAAELELGSRVVGWAEDLARRTGCAVGAGVLLQGDVVVVHHEPSPDGSRQMPEVGIVIPAHACALGKVLLAAAADRQGGAPLRGMTADTVTDPALLRAQLDVVRRTAARSISQELGARSWPPIPRELPAASA